MTYPTDNAFPWDDVGPHNGLTKREWFAGLAIKALWNTVPDDQHVLVKPDEMARAAIRMADALINQLNKEVAHD